VTSHKPHPRTMTMSYSAGAGTAAYYAQENAKLLALFQDATSTGFAVQVPSTECATTKYGLAYPVLHWGGQTDEDVADGRGISSPVLSESSAEPRGVCTICAEDALAIFVARKSQLKRDRLASRLAEEFSISPKAVRDIWNLRTWSSVTRPCWTSADSEKFLNRNLCNGCRTCGFTMIEQACSTCRAKCTKRPTATRCTEVRVVKKTKINPLQLISANTGNRAPYESAAAAVRCCFVTETPTSDTRAPVQVPHQTNMQWIFDMVVFRDFEECYIEWEAIAETLRVESLSYT